MGWGDTPVTFDELSAYVKDTLTGRPVTVADYINTGRVFIDAVLAAADQQD